MAILLLFVGTGLVRVNGAQLASSTWSPAIHLLAGGMIIFVAYEGFELIANTAHDVKQPKTNLPRAYYSAVGFVILLYVLVAIVTVGNLPVDKIVAAKDYALAEAAKPFLGQTGFILSICPRSSDAGSSCSNNNTSASFVDRPRRFLPVLA